MLHAKPGNVSRAGEEAPARRDGHARLRQPLSRGAGGHRDLRRDDRRGLRPRRRATSWSRSTAARAASATRSAPSSCKRMAIAARAATASRCPTASSPARRSTPTSASSISARCARRSTARSPTARSSRTSCARCSRDILPQARLPLLYDVSHNTCKVEEHGVDGGSAQALRAPQGRDARLRAGPSGRCRSRCARSGQPVLIGGSMGTGSYVLAGTQDSPRRWPSARPATAPGAP